MPDIRLLILKQKINNNLDDVNFSDTVFNSGTRSLLALAGGIVSSAPSNGGFLDARSQISTACA